MSALIRLVAAAIFFGLTASVVGAVVLPKTPTIETTASSLTPIATVSLAASDKMAAPALIERSPFASDRSAFERGAAMAPPAAPLEVRLAGVFKVGKRKRASLVIDGQPITVGVGDETPIGAVKTIEDTSVTIEGATPRRIDMFKQQSQ